MNADTLRELVARASMDPERWGESGDDRVSRIISEWQDAQPAQAAQPVAWSRQDTINDDDGHPIGMDEPRVVWGAECPDPDESWMPLYAEPALGRGVPAQPALHPATADLVRRFSAALAEKLAAAEQKYGYSDNWARPDWMDECRQHLLDHIAKGDPRDVAAYCAFLWHHGEHTSPAQAVGVPDGWEFQHEETGLTTVLMNDGVNNRANFEANNPRHQYVGDIYRTPPAQPSVDAHDIAKRVREALDRRACPDHWMVLAYEAVVSALADSQPSAEAKYRYALSLFDAAEQDGDGMSGVAFDAQVPIELIDGKSASELAEMLCEDAARLDHTTIVVKG